MNLSRIEFIYIDCNRVYEIKPGADDEIVFYPMCLCVV